MSEDALAYRLLKSANLSNHYEQLIKATLPELQYDLMKDQLKKTFSDSSRHVPTKEDYVKTEEDLVAEMNQLELRQENYFDTRNDKEYYPFRDAQEDIYKPIYNNFQSYGNQMKHSSIEITIIQETKTCIEIINTTINKHKDLTKQLDLNNHYQNNTQNIKRTPVTIMEYNLDV